MLHNRKVLVFSLLFLIAPILIVDIFSDEQIDLWMETARDYEKQEEYLGAMFYFEKVIKVEPDNFEALNGKGGMLFRLSKNVESEIFVDKALQINPDYIPAIVNKGIILGSQNNTVESLEYFNRALELDTKNVSALINKATLFSINKDERLEALDILNLALEIDPNNIEAIENKQKLYDSLEMVHQDGIIQTIIRDKNGNLVGYFESDHIKLAYYPTITNKVFEFWKNTNTVYQYFNEGEEFSLIILEGRAENYTQPGKYYHMRTGGSVLWYDRAPQNETLSMEILYTRTHGAIVEETDEVRNIWNLIVPND